MNPVEKVIRALDAGQQRFTPTAFVFGVIKKYGDDNGGVLASNLAYSAFVSIFPLLLILTTILGLVASVNPSVRTEVLNAVSGQVPAIGTTLTGNVHELKRSSIIGLIIGFIGLLWGATGLAQAGLFTMEQVWNLPGPARPGFVQRLGRAMLFIALLGGGVIVTTGLASFNTYVLKGIWAVIGAEVLAAAFNIGMYTGAFRVLTPKGVPTRALMPGVITGGILWTVLQVLGTWLVHHFLHSDSVYGIFGIVLGLLAWIYLAVQLTVYSAEINVVLSRRLWPRSIVQPPLTEADRASMALQALQNQRRPEQRIEVTFDDRAPSAPEPVRTPRTPEEVAPPAEAAPAEAPPIEVPADAPAAGVRVPEPRPGAGSASRHDRAQ
ncbi:MAG TPA: YihY/virulence factor BrkB family protein [Streptosporangiaceae bacterium]|nr:YihY/virulence factor BrkB family protein [Streptosporangiaceae bacterium]